MSIVDIFLMSLIQGASEFLPISSSGHLVIMAKFLNLKEESLAFDVALHLGTALSIVVFFIKDFWLIVKSGLKFISFREKNPIMVFQIVISIIPAVIFGLIILKFNLEIIFRVIPLIAVNLIVFGILLYWVDKKSPQITSFYEISNKKALLIGMAQALALIPGVSRSGICITVSRLLKIEKESAIKFSMLISIPAIVGASLLIIIVDFKTNNHFAWFDFALGITLSFIFGLIFIKLLLELIKRFSLKIFMIYRIILGTFLLSLYYFY